MQVELTDVTLRDGLQMEGNSVPTEQKLELFKALSACGYHRLEITSFVSPKWMPQFQDTDAFCEAVYKLKPKVETMAFVPNEKGLERLLKHPIPWVSVFVATSEEFNRKNVNASIDETLQSLHKVVAKAHAEKRKVRIYISTVFGCPYQGAIPEDSLHRALDAVAALKPDEIALSDTIGVAVPEQVERILKRFLTKFPVAKTAMHFHNTYGLALPCAQRAYDLGVRKFDGTTGGIGGCPYAKGATGNVATDELAYLFQRQGALAVFDGSATHEVFRRLAKQGIVLHSHIAEILQKGAKLYAVG